MTLTTITSRIAHAGDGVSTTFAFPFKIWAAANLKVYLRDTATLADTLQTLTTRLHDRHRRPIRTPATSCSSVRRRRGRLSSSCATCR